MRAIKSGDGELVKYPTQDGASPTLKSERFDKDRNAGRINIFYSFYLHTLQIKKTYGNNLYHHAATVKSQVLLYPVQNRYYA